MAKLQHVIDYYMDGHVAIAYCKVCSGEGDMLVEECNGPFVSGVFYFKDLTKEEFEEKYQKAIDTGK